jgi:hypothetical protein
MGEALPETVGECPYAVDPPSRVQGCPGLSRWSTPRLNDLDRLGQVIDPREMRGVEAGTPDAERAIRYVTKYVTKNLADTATPRGEHARAHFDRLDDELAVLPCSPSCANWLLYGVQPDKTKPGLVPGRCVGKVHQADTLGFTGRRVLISRNWSGKTLTDHRHDNHTWVKAILAGQESPGRDHPDRPHYGRGLPDLLAARGFAHPRPANDVHKLRAVSPVIHRAWDRQEEPDPAVRTGAACVSERGQADVSVLRAR